MFRRFSSSRVHLHLQSPPLPPASQYFNKSFLVSSEIKQWIRNEKQYTSKLMSFPSIRKNARWFYREMINLEENNRFFEGNDNHGEEIGDYFYFSEPYSLDLYRVLKGNAREYLEENRVLSVEEIVRWANAEFVSLSSVRISPNGRFIAVIADFSAQKNVPRLLVKDTKDGEISEIVCDQARNISQVEWFLDSQGLVFIDMDRNTLRGHQVFAFSLKSGALEMIFEERNGERYLSVSSSKDKEIVYITSLSKTSSEIRIVKFLESENKFDLMHVLPRKEGEIYFIDHVDRTFFILTNAHGCSEFRIDYVLKDASGVDFKNAVNLIEHDSSATIEDVEFFSDFAVLYCRNTLDGHQFMKRYKLLKKASEVIAERIDDLRFESYPFIRPGVNDNPNSRHITLSIGSPISSDQTLSIPIESKDFVLPLLEGSKIDFCSWNTYFAKSFDGEDVPFTLLSPKFGSSSVRPTLFIAYGAYGDSLSLDFNSNQLSLVKCGWNVVLCHVRGGGERGKIWYEAGKLLKKTNSFNDLECIIEHVKNSGLGNPDLFAGYGVSAGGMIFGNLINRRPGLLRALILKSPFLDVLDTMLDPSEALTQHEYGEWGNPSTSKEIYSLIKSYDPYQNLKQENVFMFPSILFRASLNDDHVPFWNSAKYIAKIRSLQSYNRSSGNVCSPSNCRPIIFAIDEIFGHSGDSSRSGSAEEAAEDYAFLHWALKIK